MVLVLGKQTQCGEKKNLTKRKEDWVTIRYPRDHLYKRLQTHLGKQKVRQSQKPPMTPECLGGKVI